MDEVQFDCPHCGRRVAVDGALQGTTVACPACRRESIVPADSPPEPFPAKVARLVSNAPSPAPESAPGAEKEFDVFEIAPVARAFWGRGVLGLLLLAAAVALFPFEIARPAQASWRQALIVLQILIVIAGACLLIGAWWRVRGSRYRLTSQRLFIRRGVLVKHLNELELYRVTDVRVDQGLVQRLLGVGDVTILSSDDSTPAVTLAGIEDPQETKETIRTHYRAARRREGVRANELIPP